MSDEKLKITLSILGGIVFALVFILLAFVLPLKENADAHDQARDTLQKMSKIIKDNKPNPPPEH